MDRRKFLIGAGSLAAGGAAATGTGAFDNVRAERGVSVSVVGDGNGYLRMVPDGSQYASQKPNGQLQLTFDQLNTNASSEFYDVFAIQNQGDEEIAIFLDTGATDTAAEAEESLQGTIAPNLDDEGIGFGVFNDGKSGAGNPNGAVAMPSAYRQSSNTFNNSFDSSPYVLGPGDVFRPDVYFTTDGDDAGTSVSGTLRVLGFTEDWAQGPAQKGP